MNIKELALNLENFILKASHPDAKFIMGGTVAEAKRMFEELKHLLEHYNNRDDKSSSPKSCATCKNENDNYGKCFYCCRKCFSDWEERT